MTKEFTLAAFINAIEQNGLRQITGSYFQDSGHLSYPEYHKKDRKIGAACAVGQAAINLGVDPDTIFNTSEISNDEGHRVDITDIVYELNDTEGMSYSMIAQHLREYFGDYLSATLFAEEFDYTDMIEGK